jgi:hypothetical protein
MVSSGKKLQNLPAVKAWRTALDEQFKFGKANGGKMKLIPKVGTQAYKKLKERQMQILAGKN